MSGDSPVLIVTGPPGVGKTTVAGILAGRSPRAVHLEADSFFGFVRSGYVEPWRPESREQNEIVMGVVARAAAGYAGAGYFTIVDGIVLPSWFLQPLCDVFGAAGHSVAYAVLRTPLSTCAERVQAREGAPSVDPSVIERLWRDFADLGDLESHVVDLDNKDPDDAADALAERLADGHLAI